MYPLLYTHGYNIFITTHRYYSVYNSEFEDTLKGTSCLPCQDLNPEPLHVEQGKSRFAHDCAVHWLQRQGNTFIFKASLEFYRILGRHNCGIAYCTYDILSSLSRYTQSTY